MPKFCTNGHQIEDSWEICPYCPRTGFRADAQNLGKTRVESDPLATTLAAPSYNDVRPGVRKTVLLSEQPRKNSLMGWVVIMDGDQKGEDFRICEGQTIFGSATEADVLIKDPTVSGKHASLRSKDGKFFLTDLDSTNGTFLNSAEAAISREELKDSDSIRIGGVTLKFKAL